MRRMLAQMMTKDDFFLHADMWKFPTDAQVINCGLGESNLLNIAGGLAKTGKTVYIYGVCGFVIHRYEQLKFSCRDFGSRFGKIIICNAGKHGYAQFGNGHILDDDFALMDVLDIEGYAPDNVEEFYTIIKELEKMDTGIYYIQLGKDV